MTETFASRLLKENEPVQFAEGAGQGRNRRLLKAGLAGWVKVMLLAAQGCAMVGKFQEREQSSRIPAGFFMETPASAQPSSSLKEALYRPDFVNRVQRIAQRRLVHMAPTRAGDFDAELRCLALNVYFEARSEPTQGKYAVAHVALNRVFHPRFPDTVCSVIKQGGTKVRHRCQFSWWCDGQSDQPVNRKLWAASQAIAEKVFWGRSEDPTNGALWYHANYVSPYWRRAFERGPQIGLHIFYQEPKAMLMASSR